MRRFFVEEINAEGGLCSITGSEARHISKVLRMEPGDRILLMDAKGARFLALIQSTDSRQVRVRLEKSLPKPPRSPIEIVLCQALLKSHAMDYLIQKTSELGVDSILPFSSRRTAVKLEKNRIGHKIRRWHEIARSSTKQSDRASPPRIGGFYTFEESVKALRGKEALKVILWEEERSNDLKSLLSKSGRVRSFVAMVGPEGGFAQKEIEVAGHAGFVPVSLGKRVLRSETAAVAMVAIVQYELGDLSVLKL